MSTMPWKIIRISQTQTFRRCWSISSHWSTISGRLIQSSQPLPSQEPARLHWTKPLPPNEQDKHLPRPWFLNKGDFHSFKQPYRGSMIVNPTLSSSNRGKWHLRRPRLLCWKPLATEDSCQHRHWWSITSYLARPPRPPWSSQWLHRRPLDTGAPLACMNLLARSAGPSYAGAGCRPLRCLLLATTRMRLWSPRRHWWYGNHQRIINSWYGSSRPRSPSGPPVREALEKRQQLHVVQVHTTKRREWPRRHLLPHRRQGRIPREALMVGGRRYRRRERRSRSHLDQRRRGTRHAQLRELHRHVREFFGHGVQRSHRHA